jgi:hypothetical protein
MLTYGRMDVVTFVKAPKGETQTLYLLPNFCKSHDFRDNEREKVSYAYISKHAYSVIKSSLPHT